MCKAFQSVLWHYFFNQNYFYCIFTNFAWFMLLQRCVRTFIAVHNNNNWWKYSKNIFDKKSTHVEMCTFITVWYEYITHRVTLYFTLRNQSEFIRKPGSAIFIENFIGNVIGSFLWSPFHMKLWYFLWNFIGNFIGKLHFQAFVEFKTRGGKFRGHSRRVLIFRALVFDRALEWIPPILISRSMTNQTIWNTLVARKSTFDKSSGATVFVL